MRVIFGSILVLCALLATARADDAHVRAVVLVASSTDRALTERVRGQTSDLDAEISEHDVRSVPPTLDARMREADAVVRQSSASAVIWFRVADGAVAVHVVVPAQNRVLVRTLGGGAGKPSSSTLEAAALVVRDVIRALGQGATVGELRATKEDDAASLSPHDGCEGLGCEERSPTPALTSPPPQSRTPPLTPPPAPRVATRRPTRTSLALPRRIPTFLSFAGWQAVRARDAPSFVNVLDLRMGARYGSFSTALALTLGAVDVERVTERADVLMRRHSLGLATGVTAAVGGDASVGLGVTAGAVMFVRATRSLSPAFVPMKTEAHVRAFVGPEARVAYALTSHAALVVTLGLDVVVSPPRFEVVAVPGRSAVYGLADLQPRVGVGLEWSSLKIH